MSGSVLVPLPVDTCPPGNHHRGHLSYIRDLNRKGLFPAHELNRTELHFANSSVNSRTGMHVSTNRPSSGAANQVVTGDAERDVTRRVTGSTCFRLVQFSSVQFSSVRVL